jgi:hypothetical protein
MSCKKGARVKQQTACSGGKGTRIDQDTHLAVRVVVVVVEQRRRGEQCVVVLQQLRPEAVVVLVVVSAVRRGLGGIGLVVRRGAQAGGNGGVGRRDRVPGTEPLHGAVDVGDSGVVRAGATHVGEVLGAVLGGVGVAAGELLHEGAEARGAGLDAHGVGDVHHLDRLLAAATLVPPRRRAAAAPHARTGSIAPGTVLPLPPLVVIHRSGAVVEKQRSEEEEECETGATAAASGPGHVRTNKC